MQIYKMSQKEINYDEKIKKENMICPFCDETDFDMIGLKNHLESGYCDVYNYINVSKLMPRYNKPY